MSALGDRQCPTCNRPLSLDDAGHYPQHTDFRTGLRSICPASGDTPEHLLAACDTITKAAL